MKQKSNLGYVLKYISFAVVFSALVFLIICLASFFQRSDPQTELTDVQKESPYPTIVIDAGHGGEDGGTSSGDTLEKDLNLSVALDLADMLRASGFEVVLTREDDRL